MSLEINLFLKDAILVDEIAEISPPPSAHSETAYANITPSSFVRLPERFLNFQHCDLVCESAVKEVNIN
jgi:hypothetical protein